MPLMPRIQYEERRFCHVAARCFCSAPLRVEDGLVLCTGGHIYALASAVELEPGDGPEAAD